MKKLVVILLLLIFTVYCGYADSVAIDENRDGDNEYERYDLHPYGGKGVLVKEFNNYVIYWDNGLIYDIPDNEAIEMIASM